MLVRTPVLEAEVNELLGLGNSMERGQGRGGVCVCVRARARARGGGFIDETKRVRW